MSLPLRCRCQQLHPARERPVREDYEDLYGFWFGWTLPADPTLIERFDGGLASPQLLTEVPLPNAKTYGQWVATAFSKTPAGAPPPPPDGQGFGATAVVIPAQQQ